MRVILWKTPPSPRTLTLVPPTPIQTGKMLLDRKTVSIPRACELVGVSRRTIYNWIASGKIQYVRTAGGSVRIFVDTLWREPEGTGPEEHQGSGWSQRLSRGA